MKASYTSKEDLVKALEEVNKMYDGNICFLDESNLDKKPLSFRLWTKSYDGKGFKVNTRSYKLGWTKNAKRHPAACWHVHGHFFEELFEINPNAVIYSNGSKITAESGNWIEQHAGVAIVTHSTCLCHYDYPLAKARKR